MVVKTGYRIFKNVNRIVRIRLTKNYLDLYFEDGGSLSIKEKDVLNIDDLKID